MKSFTLLLIGAPGSYALVQPMLNLCFSAVGSDATMYDTISSDDIFGHDM